MKKAILLFLLALGFNNTYIFAQKTKKEKTKKEKKTKKAKGTKDKAKETFIYDTENSEDYKKEDRVEISKLAMPKYDVDQQFQTGKKKKAQQEAFKNRKYYFPSKPQNAWQIGVFGGLSTMASDVTPNMFQGNKPAFPGHNFGLYVSKSWSYIFSTRLRYSTMVMFNNNATASTLTTNQINALNRANDNFNGTPLTTPTGNEFYAGQQFFHNSRTQGHDLNLDFVFSFGNLKFHKERTNILFKAFPALGVMMYQTFHDHFDANGNPYDYTTLANLNNLGVNNRSDIYKKLASMRDGKYETRAEEHSVHDENKFLGYNPRFIFGLGAGVTIRLAKWIYLDIESRQMFMKDDLLDGMQWQEPFSIGTKAISRGATSNFDSYNQTTLGLTFNLIGKKTTEPITMLNPIHYTYQKLAEADPEKAIDDLLKDDDGDGVPNRLDQEENTVEGAPVDPKGRAIDSDKDGIIDFQDEEPFTSPEFISNVDDKGVAKGADEMLKGKVESIVNEMELKSSGIDCDALSIELPSVHFDKDKYNIKPEYYAHIHEVAQRMLMCPASKVVATGHADKDNNSKYNEQLSYNRVDNVIDYLVDTYGIDRNRFVVKFDGENTAKGKTASEQYKERKVAFKLVESETGDSNPSEPHPGMKAGKAK